MDEPTLKYKRETLIESLNAQLAKREQDREEARQKAAERNQKAVDQIVSLIGEFPQFLVWIVDQANDGWGFTPGTDEFKEAVERAYGRRDADGRGGPDENLKRLIRVYEKAEDDVVSVSVRDEVYSYL